MPASNLPGIVPADYRAESLECDLGRCSFKIPADAVHEETKPLPRRAYRDNFRVDFKFIAIGLPLLIANHVFHGNPIGDLLAAAICITSVVR